MAGSRIPTTSILAGPCVVTQVKTQEKDGYWAVQLGFGEKKTKKTPRYLREIRLEKEPKVKVGDQVSVSDLFKVGDLVSVKGTAKGKGFAGVVKRWHFAGGPKTHGQSDRQRAPGSIGGTTTPGRVYKGKHMAGRMGGQTVTIKGLRIVAVSPERNELLVSGPVPGRTGSFLIIKRLSAGSLEELKHQVVTQVVEAEPEVSADKETRADKGGQENV